MAIRFGDCEVDPECFELRRRGRRVKIEPKVFDVMMFLVERRDRVVTKHELLDALWPGEAVSDSVLPRSIASLRRAVGDTRTRQKVIATAHGRGYRFVATIEVEPVASLATPTGGDAIDVPVSEAVPSSTGAIAELDLRPASAPTVETAGAGSLFVGRGDRIERLDRALARAAESTGGVCFLVGEPGIGKTRLAEECASRASPSGFDAYFGRCHEGAGAPVYWPWVSILRDVLEAIDDATLREMVSDTGADLAELVPELRRRIPDLPGRAGGPDGEQARFRLFDSAARFLVRVAKARPLLLVLDDLHWADASSLGLLRFLVGSLSRAPILVVATYRDVDVRRGHPLAELLGDLARNERCERITLDGFAEDEVESYVAALAGGPPSGDLVRALHARTDGNPFFLREMLHLLIDAEDLDRSGAEALDSMRLPQGVRDAIGRRLDGLSEEANEVLRAAAVVGRQFGLARLAAVCGAQSAQEREELLELLAEALDAHILVETGGGRYAFAHALTRQTLYEELRAPRRIALHRRVGEALEHDLDANRDAEERLPELAHHFFEAAAGGDVAKAVKHAVAAAESAHRRHAYDEAVSFHERAIEVAALAEPVDATRQATLLLALGEAKHTAGRRAEAMETLERAAAKARELEDWPLMARAAIALRSFGELGSRPTASTLSLLEEALERLPEAELRLRAQLESRLTHAASQTMAEREARSARALSLAERSGDATALRDAWMARWWATLGPDRVVERLEVAQALDALADRTGDLRTRLIAKEVEFGVHLIRGDVKSAEATLTQLEEAARTLRQPAFVFMAMNYRTSLLVNCGRFLEAEALVEEAFAYGDGVVPFAAITCAGQRYWSMNLRDEPIDHLANERELAGLLDGTLMSRELQALFLAIMRYSHDGDARAAWTTLEAMDLRGLERDENWLIIVTLFADIALDVGDREAIRWLYDALRPYSALVAMHDLMRIGRAAVAYTVGLLAVALGEVDAAVDCLARSVEVEDRAEMAFAAAHSRVALAGALLRRATEGDATRAAVLMAAARETVAALPIGEANRLRRFLESGDGERPFDSRLWRQIRSS